MMPSMSKSNRPIRALAAVLFFCAVGTCSDRSAWADGSVQALRKPNGYPVGLGAGNGEWGIFDGIVQQYNASGERFRIDAHCQSACTIFLSIRNVCITPNAQLLFHAGGNPNARGRKHEPSTQKMIAAYKPALRQYLVQNHYMDTFDFHTISGSEMISRFGYRACP